MRVATLAKHVRSQLSVHRPLIIRVPRLHSLHTPNASVLQGREWNERGTDELAEAKLEQ
jgi:hypothetical protein